MNEVERLKNEIEELIKDFSRNTKIQEESNEHLNNLSKLYNQTLVLMEEDSELTKEEMDKFDFLVDVQRKSYNDLIKKKGEDQEFNKEFKKEFGNNNSSVNLSSRVLDTMGVGLKELSGSLKSVNQSSGASDLMLDAFGPFGKIGKEVFGGMSMPDFSSKNKPSSRNRFENVSEEVKEFYGRVSEPQTEKLSEINETNDNIYENGIKISGIGKNAFNELSLFLDSALFRVTLINLNEVKNHLAEPILNMMKRSEFDADMRHYEMVRLIQGLYEVIENQGEETVAGNAFSMGRNIRMAMRYPFFTVGLAALKTISFSLKAILGTLSLVFTVSKFLVGGLFKFFRWLLFGSKIEKDIQEQQLDELRVQTKVLRGEKVKEDDLAKRRGPQLIQRLGQRIGGVFEKFALKSRFRNDLEEKPGLSDNLMIDGLNNILNHLKTGIINVDEAGIVDVRPLNGNVKNGLETISANDFNKITEQVNADEERSNIDAKGSELGYEDANSIESYLNNLAPLKIDVNELSSALTVPVKKFDDTISNKFDNLSQQLGENKSNENVQNQFDKLSTGEMRMQRESEEDKSLAIQDMKEESEQTNTWLELIFEYMFGSKKKKEEESGGGLFSGMFGKFKDMLPALFSGGAMMGLLRMALPLLIRGGLIVAAGYAIYNGIKGALNARETMGYTEEEWEGLSTGEKLNEQIKAGIYSGIAAFIPEMSGKDIHLKVEEFNDQLMKGIDDFKEKVQGGIEDFKNGVAKKIEEFRKDPLGTAKEAGESAVEYTKGAFDIGKNILGFFGGGIRQGVTGAYNAVENTGAAIGRGTVDAQDYFSDVVRNMFSPEKEKNRTYDYDNSETKRLSDNSDEYAPAVPHINTMPIPEEIQNESSFFGNISDFFRSDKNTTIPDENISDRFDNSYMLRNREVKNFREEPQNESNVLDNISNFFKSDDKNKTTQTQQEETSNSSMKGIVQQGEELVSNQLIAQLNSLEEGLRGFNEGDKLTEKQNEMIEKLFGRVATATEKGAELSSSMIEILEMISEKTGNNASLDQIEQNLRMQ